MTFPSYRFVIVGGIIVLLIVCIIVLYVVVYRRSTESFASSTRNIKKGGIIDQLIAALKLLPAYKKALTCKPTCRDDTTLHQPTGFPLDWCVSPSCFLGFLVQMNRDALLSPAIDYQSNYWGGAFNFTPKMQTFMNVLPFPPQRGGFDSIIISGEYPQVMILNIVFYNFKGNQITHNFVDIDLKPYNQNPFRTGQFSTKTSKKYYCVCATSLQEKEVGALHLKQITENIAWKGLALSDDGGGPLGTFIVRYYGVYDQLSGGVDVPQVFLVNSKKKQAFLANDYALPHNHFEKILFEHWEAGKETFPLSISNKNCYQFLPKGPFAGKGNVPCVESACDTDASYFHMSLTGGNALWPNPSASYMATCLVRQPGKSYLLFGQRPNAPSYPKDVHTSANADMRYFSFNFCEFSKLVNVLTGIANQQIPIIQHEGKHYFGLIVTEKIPQQILTIGSIVYLQWPDQRQALQVFYRNTLTKPEFKYSVDKSIEAAQQCFDACHMCCCTKDPLSPYRQCCQDDGEYSCFQESDQPCPDPKSCTKSCPSIPGPPKEVNVCNSITLGPQKIMKDYYPRITLIDDEMICFPDKVVSFILQQMSTPTCADQFKWPASCHPSSLS